MKSSNKAAMSPPNRLKYLLIGAGGALFVIVLLSLVLKRGGVAAVILLDMNERKLQMFPYPFTVQNIMWLLFGVGIGDAFFRRSEAKREEVATTLQLLPEDPKIVLLNQDLGEFRQKALDPSHPKVLLTSLIDQCVINFQATRSYEQTHQMMTSLVDMEMHSMDLRYTLLRYFAWLLPTLGFIGTVIGIAAALQGIGAGSGDDLASVMRPVTARLAIAFNTTMLALAMSVVVVLLTQFVQKREEEALNAQSRYCLVNLINRLHIPRHGEAD